MLWFCYLKILLPRNKKSLFINFYKKIFQRERNFTANEEVSAFVHEDEPDDDILDDVVEANACVDREPVINLSKDEEAPEYETEAAIPRKQKFSNYEKLCGSSNYDQLPDQHEETFLWSNKAWACYEWCTLKKDVLNT